MKWFPPYTVRPMRICKTCGESQPLTNYHKDPKGKEGSAASCKLCKNSKRKSIPKTFAEAFYVAPVWDTKDSPITQLTPIKIRPQPIVDNILQELSDKFDATYTVTVRRDGKTTMQIHGNPTSAYKAKNPQELLTMVL